MRFADEYVGELLERTGRTRQGRRHHPYDRLVLAGWMLGRANAAYTTASGDNPSPTLDLLTLAVLSRMVVEAPQCGRPSIDQGRRSSRRIAALETLARRLADGVLTPEQQQTVRRTCSTEWRAKLPDVPRTCRSFASRIS